MDSGTRAISRIEDRVGVCAPRSAEHLLTDMQAHDLMNLLTVLQIGPVCLHGYDSCSRLGRRVWPEPERPSGRI